MKLTTRKSNGFNMKITHNPYSRSSIDLENIKNYCHHAINYFICYFIIKFFPTDNVVPIHTFADAAWALIQILMLGSCFIFYWVLIFRIFFETIPIEDRFVPKL